ncbi:MAG: sigma-70 family RNA polymerase sigma factor [Rhodopirellula sp.]|nr:sigma-70 family RNA polymerase sigma factor [Rhodopirellula sp.]
MAAHDSKLERLPARKDRFATTHWSMVISAGGPRAAEAGRALAVLCENYWFPVYAFVRRAGHSAEDAQDLTQEFFVRLLDKHFLAVADRNKGRFRTFLLTAVKRFLANEYDRLQAKKRGGGQTIVSLDGLEARYCQEPADTLTPERIFERQWALTLLDQVLARLQAEMAADGKAALFDALKGHLTGSQAVSYATTAAGLRMTEGAVKVAAHRLRRRYRELLREEIAQTVASPDEIEEEVRYRFTCLSLRA